METFQEGFFDLVKHYGEMLERGNRINDTLYTLHDFSHHCIDIFKNLNDILLSDVAFSEAGLTSEELFVLNTSVLFHDISMAKNIHFDRNSHAEQSALFVLEEYNNQSSLVSRRTTSQQIDAIRIIIKSHSDIKTNKEKINVLDDPELVNDMPGYTRIRARLLAGLLRLADELDVTNSRIGNDLSYYNQLEKSNDSEAESMKHWKKLKFFKDIKIKKDNVSVIELIVDDLYINNEKDDRLDIIRSIKEVKEKITLECKNIMEKTILVDEKSAQYVVVRNIELKSNIKEILDLQGTTINIKPKYNLRIISFSEATSSDNKAEINLINTSLQLMTSVRISGNPLFQ
jgi:archaellum component FlaG (FlaF/FlaG flagellin family)